MSNPYDAIMPPTALDKAVDQAIAEANQAFLDSPEAIAAAEAEGDRWLAITEAEKAAGPHAVVLPVATAQRILEALHGADDEVFTTDLLARMLQDRINVSKEA